MKEEKKSISKDKKDLQKFTEIQNKISSVFALKKIMLKDLSAFTDEELKEFYNVLIEQLQTLKGDEKEVFCNKIQEILLPRTKNELWEYNHNVIIQGISSFISEYGRMPSKTQLSHRTQLSRQTIYKHLKDYKNSAYYAELQQQFNIMQSQVMATVLRHAVNGDMRAAKLYLESIGALRNSAQSNSGNNINNNTLIQNQNNYIEIGGTILNQQLIQNLNPEQINMIEGILKTIIIKDDSR
ncbi:hypothetical protein [Chryseobacterium nepalense]|uniref:hypothetical protein n=1 Tax=Chryseobacterium nepalense TaxID=1854498 RepID=UPI002E014CB7|nr:hypothetical protein [Chryseobacterium nepalense]